ncbi:hypothetical protein Tsubulata_025380 [Turnera subulata]|uniref:3-oxo-5-alpha-steroid 4-dehydrogenase C-terminal domain-containing protein n=1 Tax=Turnera subulata TaxID=218843 RepID=A0A9Q0JJZ3_9ROSI|nr:hypothetical protein Tsubulata_025380 [Turnera subulata]
MELRLDYVLGVAWIAATLPILASLLPSRRLKLLHQLVLGFARRGKIMQPSSHKFKVPQRFFLHFYLVGVAWTTFLLVITCLYAYNMVPVGSDSWENSMAATHLTGGSHTFSASKFGISATDQNRKVWISIFLLLLMEIQVLRRLYETVVVFKYSSSAEMHICGYLAGFFFYTAAPLSLCHIHALEALQFVTDQVVKLNIINHDIHFDWQQHVTPIAAMGWCQWAGAAIFAWGSLHQIRCHTILGSLREHKEQTDKYVIPHGDWFGIVSSPHYLAAMVIYAGVLVASGGTEFTIWLLLLFVVTNLSIAAVDTHRWYLEKFEDYAPNRRALIPYIF